MARELRILSSRPGLPELIACDPHGFQTLSVPIQRNQGTLEAGTFIDIDGQRVSIASQVEGVLSARVDTDELPEPPEEFSAVTAICTSGRFLWSAMRNANASDHKKQTTFQRFVQIGKRGAKGDLPFQDLRINPITFFARNLSLVAHHLGGSQ